MTVLAPERRPRWGISGLRIGIVVSLVFLLLGFVSIVWTPYPVGAVDVAAALQDPGGAHWLGTDQLGRDVLSLLMKGVLTSFVVSAVGVALGALFGIPLGLAAFAWGRPADVAVAGVAGYLAAVPVL
jgi:peptide/nickel transport system permease protein